MKAKEYRFDVLSENGEHYLVREPLGSPLEAKVIGTFYSRTAAMDERDKERTKQAKRLARNKKAKQNRLAVSSVMKDLGMTKVKGALGGTYWE